MKKSKVQSLEADAKLMQLTKICTEKIDEATSRRRDLLETVISKVVDKVLVTRDDDCASLYKFHQYCMDADLGISGFTFEDTIAVCHKLNMELGVSVDSNEGTDWTEIVFVGKRFKIADLNPMVFKWSLDQEKRHEKIKRKKLKNDAVTQLPA